MARLDIETYRKMILKPVEECMLECRGTLGNFSSFSLYEALRTEMTRADLETGLIEIPDNICVAQDEAASRVMEHMSINKDLGFGRSS